MPFPISITGCVRIPVRGEDRERVERAIRRTKEMLNEASARSVTRRGTSIRFTAGAFRLVWNLDILVPLSSGVIDIDDTGSELRLS